MRKLKWSSRFKRDIRRELRGRYGKTLMADLDKVTCLLAVDTPLPPMYRDHSLTGVFPATRDCHLHPDLVLLYRKPTEDLLELARLGSHSELSL